MSELASELDDENISPPNEISLTKIWLKTWIETYT